MKILFSSKQCLAIDLVLLYAHWYQEQKQSSHLCPQEQARAGAFYDFSLCHDLFPFSFILDSTCPSGQNPLLSTFHLNPTCIQLALP